MTFRAEQLDAIAATGFSVYLYPTCKSTVQTSLTGRDVPLAAVMDVHGDGVDGAWPSSHIEGPALRLPTGGWRITAMFSGLLGGCFDGSGVVHQRAASIDIKVVPRTGSEIGAVAEPDPTGPSFSETRPTPTGPMRSGRVQPHGIRS